MNSSSLDIQPIREGFYFIEDFLYLGDFELALVRCNDESLGLGELVVLFYYWRAEADNQSFFREDDEIGEVSNKKADRAFLYRKEAFLALLEACGNPIGSRAALLRQGMIDEELFCLYHNTDVSEDDALNWRRLDGAVVTSIARASRLMLECHAVQRDMERCEAGIPL